MQIFSRPTKSHNLSMGIVGLPNVGKSTLFNILTNSSVLAHNYPFCTIDPTEGRVAIPDERFTHLISLYKPKSTIPSFLNVTDIAGLVKGASDGLGLGNAFLDNIRTTDGIFHVIRCFEDNSVVHYDTTVDPLRDINTINTELRLKDLQLIERILEKSFKSRNNLSKDKKILFEHNTLLKVKSILETKWLTECLNHDDSKLEGVINSRDISSNNTPLDNSTLNYSLSSEEVLFISTLSLLTTKPVVYLANISHNDYLNKKINSYLRSVLHLKPILFCDKEESSGFLNKIIKKGCEVLNLITFFTVGKDEVRSWKIKGGTLLPQAGGVIHSDFEKYFIAGEVFNYKDLNELKSETEVKKKGKCCLKGKTYVVEDGDIIHFKFNAPRGGGKK